MDGIGGGSRVEPSWRRDGVSGHGGAWHVGGRLL